MSSSFRAAAVSVLTLAIAACGSGGQRSGTDSGAAAGAVGTYFDVTVFRPSNGTVTSQDGQIRCGTGGTACAGRYAWSVQAVLTATPDAGYTFGTWAGDCQYTGPCVLDTTRTGADKFVNAVFGPNGVVQHGNFASSSRHGQAFFDRLGGVPGTLDCSNVYCHGATYNGGGIAPSCNSCHARAGWANWQQSCSFCHGRKDAAAKASYDFAVHPDWAAPPDDVSMRLTGVTTGAAGAHQKHVNPDIPNAVRAPIACSECHVIPETAIHALNFSLDLPFGPLSRSQGAEPTWEASTLTCGANYCHGTFDFGGVRGAAASLTWTGTLNGCQTCHGMPPTGHAFGGSSDPRSCSGCHPDTVLADGTIDLAKGKHINGQKDAAGGACDACHWFPNSATKAATGAHLAHFGLTSEQEGTAFGDLEKLQDKYPGATPTEAPAAYAFGCGNCHPIDMAQHSMGSGSAVAKVWLYEAFAPSTSLKSKNSTSAAYDATAKTCSGVYCHSSGQATPEYRTTPAWTSTTPLTCASCHENPPRYTSGGAGSATANSHVALDNDEWPWGHWGLPMTNYQSQHGVGWNPYYGAHLDSTPITCQTCHFETTDPTNTGPSGFYYLDTTGDYAIPNRWNYNYTCTTAGCHSAGSTSAPLRAGKVLPLRHVNGTRDVVFDARTGDPNVTWLAAADDPTRPYWITDGSQSNDGWDYTNRNFVGTTVQFDLSPAGYDPATKTCTNVTCHMSQGNTSYTGTTRETRFLPLRWGAAYYYYGTDPELGVGTCSTCHRM